MMDVEKLAVEIHEQCQNGASVSDIIAMLNAQESEPVGYTSQGYIDGVKNSIGDLGNFAGNFFKNKWQNVNIPLYTKPPADKDAERLDWLMRNVSGKEFRRIGVHYGANCDREAIDEAMKG